MENEGTLLARNKFWRLYKAPDGSLTLVNEDTGLTVPEITAGEFVALKAIVEQAEAQLLHKEAA